MESSNAANKKAAFKEILSHKKYQNILIYIGISTLCLTMPLTILPAFGARWFGNCDNDQDEDCDYDFETYNFYRSLFASIHAFICSIFAAFAGSLSDLYGRKPFLFCKLLIPTFKVTLLIFYPNLWIYWILGAINGIIDSENMGTGSITSAYISDVIINPDLKTHAFALSAIPFLLFILIGTILAAVITNIFDIEIVWIIIAVSYLFLILFTICIISESLTLSQRESNQIKIRNKSFKSKYNPFRPLLYVNHNPIILWISIIFFLVNIPKIFVPILLVYINDQMHINDDAESTTINMIVFVTISVFGGIYVGVLLPFFKKKFVSATDVNLCIVGGIMVFIAPLIWSIIPFIIDFMPNIHDYDDNQYYLYCIIIIVAGSICLAFMTFIEPPLAGILTKYINKDEHGTAFGITNSFRNIARIISPFGFGYGYNLSKDIGIPSLMLYIIAILMFICLLIMIFPLKKLVQKLEVNGEIFTFNKCDIDIPLTQTKDRTNTKQNGNENNYVTFQHDK